MSATSAFDNIFLRSKLGGLETEVYQLDSGAKPR